jgi:nicotinamidase-related amidase
VYCPGVSQVIEDYVALPVAEDAALQRAGQRTLKDYYAAAVAFERASDGSIAGLRNALAGGGTTTLAGLLRAMRTQTLVVCGFCTNVCVASSIYSAHERGFRILLVGDATGSEIALGHSAYLQSMGHFVAIPTSADEVSATLKSLSGGEAGTSP